MGRMTVFVSFFCFFFVCWGRSTDGGVIYNQAVLPTPSGYLVPGFAPIDETVVVEYYFGKSIVIFKDLKLQWMDAYLKCKRHGMRIVTFDSIEEFDHIFSLLIRYMETSKISGYVHYGWAGATDEWREGNFTWIESGKPYSEFYNTKIEPNNGNAAGNEHCVEFLLHPTGNITIVNDYQCSFPNGVICEY